MLSRQVRVGFFLVLGVIVLGVMVFLIGDERHLFDRQAHLRASFRDVAGLKVGSPVRMGGVDVGAVSKIEFGRTESDHRIHVRFTIVASQLARVRNDSVVRIASKGLLGDKAVDITMGSTGPAAADDSVVRSEESDDMASALSAASSAMQRANEVLGNVATATRPLASPQLGNDITALVHDLRTISRSVAEGPGTVHTLLTDPNTSARIERTLASVEATANRLAATSAEADAVMREARSGHGLIHALVSDRHAEQMLHSVARATDEVAAITHDVRTGNGGLHQIIYGTDSSQAVANVNAATASLRDILGNIQQGRGTVGALLTDPSLYEDMKTLVGNVQRNEILRAMVRYSIHDDEQRRPAVNATPAQRPQSAP